MNNKIISCEAIQRVRDAVKPTFESLLWKLQMNCATTSERREMGENKKKDCSYACLFCRFAMATGRVIASTASVVKVDIICVAQRWGPGAPTKRAFCVATLPDNSGTKGRMKAVCKCQKKKRATKTVRGQQGEQPACFVGSYDRMKGIPLRPFVSLFFFFKLHRNAAFPAR